LRNLKTILLITVIGGALLLCPGDASAAFFGQVTTARILERGVQDFSAFAGFFDHTTTFFGQARRGLSRDLDGGIQFGFIDREGGDVGIALGGDLKFGMISGNADKPLDLAIDGRAAYFNLDHFSIFEVGASLVASYPFALSSGSEITPYGAFNLRVERLSVDDVSLPDRLVLSRRAASTDKTDTDLELAFMTGILWEVSDLVDLLGELVIDDQIGFIFGVNFKI
jgi:hypothetical protein